MKQVIAIYVLCAALLSASCAGPDRVAETPAPTPEPGAPAAVLTEPAPTPTIVAASPATPVPTVPATAVSTPAPVKASPAPVARGPQVLVARAVSVSFDGDSTLHAFHCKSEETQILARTSRGGALLDTLRAGGLESLAIKVPVKSLKSGKGGLDKNMYKAMNEKDYPLIRFEMDRYSIEGGKVNVWGVLEIHGQSKEVALQGELDGGAGEIHVKGSYEMLMSDYGIKPPVMMLGTIKTADKVVVHYEYSLAFP